MSGEIGEIVSFNGRIGNNGERVKNTWFWDKSLSGGGTFIDNGCHLVDIARWFMGDFSKAIGAISNIYWKEYLVEDMATGIFMTDNGKTAIINSSWRLLAGYLHFELNGSDGYITVDGRFDTHGGDKVFWRNKVGKVIKSEDFGHVPPISYVLELDAFYSSILNDNQPEPSGEDGIEIMKMIEAVYKSDGRVIDL